MLQFLGMLAAIGLTAMCWGMYGPVLHVGREDMHSPLRPFVCVGIAYFVIAVLVPALLLLKGEKGAWTTRPRNAKQTTTQRIDRSENHIH